jgi:hypothetical protein
MIQRFNDTAAGKYNLAHAPGNVLCIQPTPENIERYRSVRECGEHVLFGAEQVPALGSRVRIGFNSLGTGTVESYFVEHGWLGVCVVLDVVPTWKQKQQKDTPLRAAVALVFGAEITQL